MENFIKIYSNSGYITFIEPEQDALKKTNKRRTKKERCFEVKIIVKRLNLTGIWKITDFFRIESKIKPKTIDQLENRGKEGKTHRDLICKTEFKRLKFKVPTKRSNI